MSSLRKVLLAALLLLAAARGAVQAQVGTRVENWTVPEGSSKTTDISRPVSFIAVLPCRIVDTRDPSGPYGGPALAAATQRDFDLNSGPCPGIPIDVQAYSLNFTATQTQGFGDLRVWPAGPPPPVVSTLNYVPNQTVANAAIVPAGLGGAISVVAAVSGTHLIIDINGYLTDRPNDNNSWSLVMLRQGTTVFNVQNNENLATFSGGISGRAFSDGNHSYGVYGQSSSAAGSEIGGVLGRIGGTFVTSTYGPAGVRGESFASFGALGISRDSLGVGGSNVNGAGAEQSWGGLACTDTQAVCGMGTLSVSGSKSFVEPHPTDASKVIKYVSLEGNEAGTYFRGRARFERGLARIRVPEDFRMVTEAEGLSIQVTPIGEMASVAVVRIDLNEVVVKGSRNVEFFYTVNGVRRGYGDFAPIAEEGFFAPRSSDYRMPESLSPEAKRKLIANGTYNADGTVNMETAKRLGWTKKWKSPIDSRVEPQGREE